jgi:hypothetical protein
MSLQTFAMLDRNKNRAAAEEGLYQQLGKSLGIIKPTAQPYTYAQQKSVHAAAQTGNVVSPTVTPPPKPPDKIAAWNDYQVGGVVEEPKKDVLEEPKKETPAYTPPAYTPTDYTSQVNGIFDPMIASNLASLKSAYDKARSDINAQIPGVQQNARQARTSNESDYYTKSLPELYRAMEATGQRGGENVTGNIAANTVRGSNLGQINTTEMNNLAALQKAIADLNAEQPLKETEIQQKSIAEKARMLAELNNAEKIRYEGYNREDARNAVLDTRYNTEYKDEKAYRASRDAILDKRYTDETTYSQERDRIRDSFEKEQFDWQKEQADLDRDWDKGQFDYQKARDLVTDERYSKEWNQKLDEYVYAKEQDAWNKEFQTGQFNYQVERDKLNDKRYSAEVKFKLDQWAWEKSSKNPQVQSQILNNKVAELELKNLPAKLKAELDALKADARAGNLSNDIAKKELDNLENGLTRDGKDPNASTNKVTYDSVISQHGNESGEDIYHALVDGELGLTPGSNDYNQTMRYAQNKYYDQIVDNFNQGKYANLEKSLRGGAFGDVDYYKKTLGMDNFNRLISMYKTSVGA